MEFSTPFEEMTDDQLLKAEQDLYAESWRAATRSAVTVATGAMNGLATGGVSAAITAPMLAHRTNYNSGVKSQLDQCSAIVRERGLKSLGTPYCRIVGGSALTCTVGAVAMLIPGLDAAADAVIDPIADQVFDIAGQSVDTMTNMVRGSLSENSLGRKSSGATPLTRRVWPWQRKRQLSG